MREQIIDLPFPVKGLAINVPYSKQPNLTTLSALNCRGYDPLSGRTRGGQRSGLNKYSPTLVNGANVAIQDINRMVAESQAALPAGPTTGAVAHPLFVGPPLVLDINTDPLHNLQLGNITNLGLGTCWDPQGNVYVAKTVGGNTSIAAYSVGFSSSSTPNLIAGSLWTSSNLPNGNNSKSVGMVVGGGFLWILTTNVGASAMFLYKLQLSNGAIVGGTHVYTTSRSPSTQTYVCNPIAYCQGVIALGYASGFVDLYNVAANTATTIQIQAANTPDILDIDTDANANFYIAANKTSGPLGYLSKIDLLGNVIWSNATTNINLQSCCYDPINTVVATSFFGGAYNLALFSTTGTLGSTATPQALGTTPKTCVRLNGTGGYVWSDYQLNGGGPNGTVDDYYVNAALSTVTHVNYNPGAYQSNQPSAIATNLPPVPPPLLQSRVMRALAAAGGTIVRISPTGNVALAGGTGALSPAAVVAFSTQINQQLYYVDGAHYVYYDGPSDSIKTLSASQGSLPQDSNGFTARLCASWRNRFVLSGLPFDPNNWFMSAVSDPTNWNYNPSPSVETQAVAGNLATAGLAPDAIQAIVPYSDEILLLGCAQTLYQMTGDPVAGGRIDLVTDQIGMAWGRPYCRDGQGTLYFFSSRGSIYQFTPGGLPQRISDNIGYAVQNVHLESNIIRMAWDELQRGFHVWISPIVGPAFQTFHFFWDQPNQAWWQDQYANGNHNPLAVCVMEGNTPTDRVILIGSWDGYVRYVNPAALDDDGTGILSYVGIGPIWDQQGNPRYLADLQCDLDLSSGPVTYFVNSGNAPEDVAISTTNRVNFTGTFGQGRSRSQPVRAFGHAHYVTLQSANLPATGWQLEYLKARVRIPEGKSRQRIFT